MVYGETFFKEGDQKRVKSGSDWKKNKERNAREQSWNISVMAVWHPLIFTLECSAGIERESICMIVAVSVALHDKGVSGLCLEYNSLTNSN